MSGKEQQQIFDQWLKDYRSVLFKVIRAYAFKPADRDDLFQDISIQLWKSIPNFKGTSSVATWIYRVAFYAAISWTRRETKYRNTRASLEDSAYVLRSQPQANHQKLDWLYAQIAQLNEVDRSLTLLLLDGYSYKEMAQVLGISESNVGVKINRIKKKLSAAKPTSVKEKN